MESAMCESRPVHLSSQAWTRMTPDQQLRVLELIITQARLARDRALRELLRRPLQLLWHAAYTLWRAAAEALARKRAMRELHALDDRSLRDMGLGRSEIETAVRGAPR